MHAVRKKKLILIVFFMVVLTLFAGLILYALRQNINLFYSPTQIANGEARGQPIIRLGGMVVPNSVHRSPNSLDVQFKLSDYAHTVTVTYQGILPDLFREGQGIVALGVVVDAEHFKAQQVLAKHDANYMPPEVKKMLAAQKKAQE